MSLSVAQLRRTVAKRMQFWGGDIASGLAGATTAAGKPDGTTLIDTTREELDDEWDSSYVVLNPGTVNAVWRRAVAAQGFTLSNGTLRVTPGFPTQVGSGTPYEIYKTYKPNDWLDALNYAILEAYPNIHRRIDFELPMDTTTRVVDAQYLLYATQIAAPTSAPVATAINSLSGVGAATPSYPAGTWTVGYSYYNELGETLLSPTSTVATTLNQGIDIAAITIPVTIQAIGVRYYCSFEANSTILAQLGVTAGSLLVGAAASSIKGVAANGVVPEIQFAAPPPPTARAVPLYNTTGIDFIQINRLQERTNPGVGPEIWNDLGGHLWSPLGDNSFQVNFLPIGQFNLRILGMAPKPQLVQETDITDIPQELIMWGAEKYLWNLLTKSSTVVNVNWEKLETNAEKRFNQLKAQYQTTPPPKVRHRPYIRSLS